MPFKINFKHQNHDALYHAHNLKPHVKLKDNLDMTNYFSNHHIQSIHQHLSYDFKTDIKKEN